MFGKKRRKDIFDLFDEFFSKFLETTEREFYDDDERFDSMFKRFDSKFFRPKSPLFDEFPPQFSDERSSGPKFIGYSIRYQAGTDIKPKVEVRSFGSDPRYNKRWVFSGGPSRPRLEPARYEIQEEPTRVEPPPVEFKEPVIEEFRENTQHIINVKLSGIKDKNQIDVKKLAESLEIKAIDIPSKKGYFCIIKIPSDLVNLDPKITFKEGVLRITWFF
jgi:hypothetical protein